MYDYRLINEGPHRPPPGRGPDDRLWALTRTIYQLGKQLDRALGELEALGRAEPRLAQRLLCGRLGVLRLCRSNLEGLLDGLDRVRQARR